MKTIYIRSLVPGPIGLAQFECRNEAGELVAVLSHRELLARSRKERWHLVPTALVEAVEEFEATYAR